MWGTGYKGVAWVKKQTNAKNRCQEGKPEIYNSRKPLGLEGPSKAVAIPEPRVQWQLVP